MLSSWQGCRVLHLPPQTQPQDFKMVSAFLIWLQVGRQTCTVVSVKVGHQKLNKEWYVHSFLESKNSRFY